MNKKRTRIFIFEKCKYCCTQRIYDNLVEAEMEGNGQSISRSLARNIKSGGVKKYDNGD